MYHLHYDRRIEKDIRPIPKIERQNILNHISRLANNPRGHQVEKLAGIDGYRLRVGTYRVLFVIDDSAKLVTVHRILHRREAYR